MTCTRHASVRDGVISIVLGEQEVARIPICENLLIGEFTNAAGPYTDDYFLCIFTENDGEWYQLSSDIPGMDDVVRALMQWSGGESTFELYRSASLCSRVSWPPVLAGEPLFDFQFTPCTRWYHYLFKWLGVWPVSYRNQLSPRVAEYLDFASIHRQAAADLGKDQQAVT